MQVFSRNIDDIVPYGRNPRHNDGAVDAVAASIREFGFKVPIIVDENDVIVAGHTRLKAAKRLGLTEVPVIVADDLTDEQVKAFRLADNKVGELAEWDMGLLDMELGEISLDMGEFGFEPLTIEYAEEGGEANLSESGFKYAEQYAVIVTCEDEGEQERVYNKLNGEGYSCKVVTV